MAALGKGDWVQCIDAGPNSRGEQGPLESGGVYCVRKIVPAQRRDGAWRPGLLLVGIDFRIRRAGRLCEQAFSPARFRPLGGNTKTITAPPIRQTQDA